MIHPSKVDILGTSISLGTSDGALRLIAQREGDRPLTFAFCNVHTVMTCRTNTALAQALLETDVCAPDGMPLVWALRWIHGIDQPRLRGPTFMRAALQAGVAHGWGHFFYGATSDTIRALERNVNETAPGVRVVGSIAPPFRVISDEELAADLECIRTSGADLLWIGLGMPKQELAMARMAPHLPGVTLLAVGAAFDLLAGNLPEAPDWMQREGLEWLYRLFLEPRRLWRRYLWNNPAFIVRLGIEAIKHRVALVYRR